MNKMTVRDIDVAGKRVLVRVDFNVPVDQTGAITDDSRIRASLPTIKYLLDRKASVILMSHFGRPKGKVVNEMRLAPVGKRLAEILGKPVKIVDDCIGPSVESAAKSLKPGEILLLENLRFHAEEEAGDANFAKALASLGEVYVNDAFGTSHRPHASISGIANYLPAVAGFLLEKEINTLGNLIENPAHPFTSIFGGAKVSDKVAVLNNIMKKVDCLLIGGGMAATFLKAKGVNVGTSVVEDETVATAAALIKDADTRKIKLFLPVDVVVADDITAASQASTIPIETILPNKKIADIGPRTVDIFNKELKSSKTVFWNGPMGVHEVPQFANGTRALATVISKLKATTVMGGGSTAEVIDAMGLTDKVTFVSTGGGASLEFLGGDALPGVTALMDKK